MGIGFVVLLHFVLIFILGCIVAIVSAVVTYFVSNSDKKKRKLFLSAFIPFQVLYTLYILGLTGSIIVSEVNDVDIGIGDAWYAPLNENCRILMIDLPDHAFIECDGQSLVSEVLQIQQIDNRLFGKTSDNTYFALDLANHDSRMYSSSKALMESEKISELNLVETQQFYNDRKWEVSGRAITIVGLLALGITILIAFVLIKLTLYNWRLPKIRA